MTNYEKLQTKIDCLTIQGINAKGVKRVFKIFYLRITKVVMDCYKATHFVSKAI